MFPPRIVLCAPVDPTSDVLARRLGMQGYEVELVANAEAAARASLAHAPAAVVADLWMPGISGVQLCRLLRAEPSTANVPVVLCGPEGQRNRFWAERAGATAYVVAGRVGELARTLEAAIDTSSPFEAGFFTQLPGAIDVRDRIAHHLDEALFDSVVAAEVRALASCGDFERLFDVFSQLAARITSYRWLAIASARPSRLALHAHPSCRNEAEAEARAILTCDDPVIFAVEDGDARAEVQGPVPFVEPIGIGREVVGSLAMAICAPEHPTDRRLVSVMARELAGPLRIVSLLDESRRQATTDALTGLLNRRAFVAALDREIDRARRHDLPLSVAMLDVDHFKSINDGHGHGTGDAVLAALGEVLRRRARKADVVGRWGGEEFIVALTGSDPATAVSAAERLRADLAELSIRTPRGTPLRVTASIGVAQLKSGDSLEGLVDRADRAMYLAKTSGRDRVISEAMVAGDPVPRVSC